MFALPLFIASFLICVAWSQGIHCGIFDDRFIEHNGTCMFRCYDGYFGDFTYYDPSQLSFAEIRRQCQSVDQAARLFGCTESDLVYRSDECGCPYCKCYTEDNIGSIEETVMYDQNPWYASDAWFYGYGSEVGGKICLHCTCSNATKHDIPIPHLIYQCNILAAVDENDPENWHSYRCPPACGEIKPWFDEYYWNKSGIKDVCANGTSCGYKELGSGYLFPRVMV